MGCPGCPSCLGIRVVKQARGCPSADVWDSQQPVAKQGTLAVGLGTSPTPPITALSPMVGWQPWWSSAFPRGQRSWALAAPVGVGAAAREREGTMATWGHLSGKQGAFRPTGKGSAKGLGEDS